MIEIDKKTVIELLQGVRNQIKSAYAKIDKLSKSAFDIAIQALEEQQQQRWITVSEKLPDKDDVYLVTFEENGKRYTERFYFSTMLGWLMPVFWQNEGRIEKIIAWRELPEPYKEYKNE